MTNINVLVREWLVWDQENSPKLMVLQNSSRLTYRIRLSDDTYWFFITIGLSDKRDLSGLRFPPQTERSAFQHQLYNWCKKHGLVGSIPNCNTEDGHGLIISIACRFWRSLDTDLSHTLADLAELGTDEAMIEVLSATVNPNDALYCDSDTFLRDYAAISFLRKYSGFSFKSVDPEKAARNAWAEAELKCRETNRRFYHASFSKDDRAVLFAVRKLLTRILGASPSISEVREHLRLGPGATASCPSSYCSVLDKIDQIKTVGSLGASLAPRILTGSAFEFCIPRLTVSSSTRGAIVPKTWATGRPIEVPQDVDVLVQLSLGRLIRNRLKRFGLDLDTQAARNGDLACMGSKTGLIATIDLKSASDTISHAAVKACLPQGWYNFLCQFRSPFIEWVVDGQTFRHRNEKFSAMGNGFTFELESLLFLAITLVSCGLHHERKLPDLIGIFGDDICCPTEHAMQVIKNLELYGFSVNWEKSFLTGPFRESCGQDFFLGAPVRPYFQKDKLTDVTKLYVLANGIRRLSVRSCYYLNSDLRYRPVWEYIVHLIPREYRVFGPTALGDTAIWGNPGDGIQGEWPIQVGGVWSYRRGPIRAIQRGINLYSYAGSTLMHGWFLVKGDKVSKPFEKMDIDPPFMKNYQAHGDVVEASMLPRSFRKVATYRPRYRRSQMHVLTACDCPGF